MKFPMAAKCAFSACAFSAEKRFCFLSERMSKIGKRGAAEKHTQMPWAWVFVSSLMASRAMSATKATGLGRLSGSAVVR